MTTGKNPPDALTRGVRALILVVAIAVAALAIARVDHTHMKAARLLETIFVLAALSVGAWAVRGGLRNAMVVACSLLFGLAVLEGATLALGAFARKPPVADFVVHDPGLGGSRPVVGWGAARPGVFHVWKTAPDGRIVYDTTVTIDAHLDRKTVPSGGSRPVVFFGDSWIFGAGVEDGGTLPQAFADLARGKIPVVNLGFDGWSPAANLATLETGTDEDLLTAPRRFILFTSTFHVERTACRGSYATSQAPRYVLDGGAVRYAGPCAAADSGLLAKLVGFAKRSSLYARIAPKLEAPGKRDVETYIKIIETFMAEAKRLHGAQTTILFAPFRDEYIKDSGYTEADIVATLRASGADVIVDRLPPIADEDLYWITDDGHPTALANRARAKEIAAHLEKLDPNILAVAGPQAPTR